MALTEDLVLERLREVIDPELLVNVVDLGLIYTVSFLPREDELTDVAIQMTMTSPACPAAPQLMSASKLAVTQIEEVGEVTVELVMSPPWTPDRMTEDARDQLGMF